MGTALHLGVMALVIAVGVFWTRLSVPWMGTCPASGVALGVLVGTVAVGVSWLVVRRTESGGDLARLLAGSVAGLRLPEALVLALGAGIAEEAVFRGALWTLIASLWGDGVALALTSVAFGAVHGGFSSRMRTWSLFALGVGAALGGLRWATGGILAPIVAHVLIDAINLPLLARQASRTATDESGNSQQQNA